MEIMIFQNKMNLPLNTCYQQVDEIISHMQTAYWTFQHSGNKLKGTDYLVDRGAINSNHFLNILEAK